MDNKSGTLSQGYILRGSQYTYTIQRVLGQGTFGITYLATMQTTVTGKMGGFNVTVKVAVKEFFMKELNGREGSAVTSSSQNGYFTDYKRKFLREAENLTKLQHPNIVKVLEAFETNGTAYYAMEYLEGGSLENLIQKRGALSEKEALGYTSQIASALECMHSHNMLHLDLKPGNVMLRETGEAVLIDFGLSKQFDENGEPESSTSLGGGTPGYAPIEQTNYQRGDGLPVTMDVYALGATLYKMLTGQRPPNADVVLNEDLPIQPLRQKGISMRIIDAIVKAMAPVKRNRYQSVDDFLKSLGGVVASSPVEEEHTVMEGVKVKSKPKVEPEPELEPVTEPTLRLKPKSKANKKWLIVGACLIVTGLLSIAYALRGETEEEYIEPIEIIKLDSTPRTFTANGVEFTMIPVEGGTFQMGSNYGYSEETPVHSVTLSSYYIGQTEVTQALWLAVMGSNPSNFKGNNLPVECVSWEDCQTFITKLNQLTGQKFRLPTEAEWEYAARGGKYSKGYRYSGSNTFGDVAWYDNNSGGKTHPVATKQANELGLYDMSGNVWEWCQDWYGSYSSSSQINPAGPTSGFNRVYRGDSWGSLKKLCRVSYRGMYAPLKRDIYLGLRLAMSADQSKTIP